MLQTPLLQKQGQWHPNRSYLTLPNGIVVDSCFPGGNLASATIAASSLLTLEVEGNTDVSLDTSSKYWLYFRLRGFRRDKPVKFLLRNANHLRKFLGQSRYRPYMMVKEEEENWQANPLPIDVSLAENGQLQGTFLYQSERHQSERQSRMVKSNRSTNQLGLPKDDKLLASTAQEGLASTATGKEKEKRGDCYFAVYQPYSYEDLVSFIAESKAKHGRRDRMASLGPGEVYFNEETIAFSYERRKIPLLTITSTSNIESCSEREPVLHEEIFPFPKDRPCKLKNNPVVVVTARVHPSETSSSFFAEGLVAFLLGDGKASALLRQLFIFQVMPMLNPDGVEHGNFRFDHEMRNLNRFYGQSSIEKTPSIRAAELLISYFKNRNNEQCQFTEFYEETYNRLFMYLDIHGHSSAMPSYIYGNHSQKVEHLIENKMLCKLIETNFLPGGFSQGQSEFSKKNMTVQEKYDEYSKLGAGRVFAGTADVPQSRVFHSYTIEVLPYWEEFPRRKVERAERGLRISAAEYARLLGKETMVGLLELLGLNPESRLGEAELDKIRRSITKECLSELTRKGTQFRRVESSAEWSAYSEVSKVRQSCAEKETNFCNQYILRWFSNQVLLRNFEQKCQLLKEHKFTKFHQKILRLLQKPPIEADQTPSKDCQLRPPESEHRSPQPLQTYDSTGPKDEDEDEERDDCARVVRSSKCFISREDKRKITNEERMGPGARNRERRKVQSKISKQTLELGEGVNQLASRQRIERDPVFRFPKREYAAKRELGKRESIQSPDRSEREPVGRLYSEHSGQKAGGGPLFQIKIKQIRAKKKPIVRIQTEGVVAEAISGTAGTEANAKIKGCNSQAGTFNLSTRGADKHGQFYKDNYHNPSFIEEFILKIREEREGMPQDSNNKLIIRDDLRQKAMKFRPAIREVIEQQDRNMLPVLKRNKIFTLADKAGPKETGNGWHNYDYETMLQSRKRASTLVSEGPFKLVGSKAKKLTGGSKPEHGVRESLIKKSQEYLDNDFS